VQIDDQSQTLLQRLNAAGFSHNATLELIKPKHFEREGLAPHLAIAAAAMSVICDSCNL
jgi:hypothetical protein